VTPAQFDLLHSEIADLRREVAAIKAQLPKPVRVLTELGAAWGACTFTSAQVIDYARRQSEAAEATGLRPPPLPAALAEARLTTARRLGRFLARHEGRGVIRVKTEASGVIWCLMVGSGSETMSDVQREAVRQ
jgi:hypothetical protein